MRHFFTILGHEVRMLLVSPSTYVAGVLFLAVMGFIFTGILKSYSAAPQEISPAQVFFQLFWLPVLFLVPLLTMKCLAEERRLGEGQPGVDAHERTPRQRRVLGKARDAEVVMDGLAVLCQPPFA